MRAVLRWGLLLLLGCSGWGAAAPAAARCQQCSSDFLCLSASEGALLCVGFGQSCTMAGACFSRPSRDGGGFDDPMMEAVTSITVLDEPPAAVGPTGVRVERLPGGDLAAEGAARAWAARTGAAARPTLLAGLMHGQGLPIAVRTRDGDGFVLERRDTRQGIRIVVRSLFAGNPGHVIVSRYVEEGDLVALRTNIGGRGRVVLLQPLRLSATADAGRIAAMQAAVGEAARSRPARGALEVEVAPAGE